MSCWEEITERLDQPLTEIPADMLQLLAIADEACGQLMRKSGRIPADSFGALPPQTRMIRQLIRESQFESAISVNDGQSLCQDIHPSRLRVLPKFRVPQRGLTLRSLSLFAGLLPGSELDSRFLDNEQVKEDLTLNLLVVPWPFEVKPSQFRQCNRLQGEMTNMAGEFGFFTFAPSTVGRGFTNHVLKLVSNAEEECGPISIVVLPELALSDREAAQLRNALAKRHCGLVAGVGEHGMPGKSRGSNRVQLYVPGLEPVDQQKHHRWKLDRSQIIQYSLGNSLHHEQMWWEHIDVADRRLSFLRLMPWLTLCVLICEDLARPDPAGDAIRAVGPNLVISLLMDGPQLTGRWANRYATTLSDDPGSSVLAVTSLGMSELSRPSSGPPRSRVIGLWKEEGAGSVEIELPIDRDAAVLSVSTKGCIDWSADGRSREAFIPSLTGIRYLKWPGLKG
jgi:hypothetical protein